eukprot:gene1115-4343_t
MSNLEGLVQRLETVAIRLEGVTRGGAMTKSAGGASSNYAPDVDTTSVDQFDEILNGVFADFLAKGRELGGDLSTQLDIVERAFQAQRTFLDVATKSKQPSSEVLMKLLQPTSTALTEAQEFREKNRRSTQFNHLSAISEGIPALAWVTIAPKPAPHVRQMKDAAQFYTNRVLMEFKDKEPRQVEWAKSWMAVFDSLHDYIKDMHTTGLVWNKDGQDASSFASATAGAPKPAASTPKPIPAAKPASSGTADARSGLFAALNKGDSVTSGLKKVDRSQMTHKNPALRATSVVPSAEKSPSARAPAAPVVAAKKDPVLELVGKKWTVEYHHNNRDIVIDGDIKQSVYVYKCENSTIKINGKVNSITCDGCKKIGVVFESAVGVFEAINCKSVQVQIMDKVPTVSIDKTDGFQVYLSENCLDTQIVSAKSSEMNVLIPVGDGDFKELPVPEQYKTTVVDGALVTEATDIAG